MATRSVTTDLLSEQRRSLSEQREQMIAEAAYYRAERRGFCTGDPLTDWLESETEIDILLCQEGVDDAAAEKESLLHRLESRLHEWDQKLEEFTAAATDTRQKLGAELHEQIVSLAVKRDVARQKLTALRDLSADAWHDVREHTVHFFDDVHSAIERVTARLKQVGKSDSKGATSNAA
jgi:uncharacterized coiled-coil DUF342 family protein